MTTKKRRDAETQSPSLSRHDVAFAKWFRKHGWRIYRRLRGIEVWAFNDRHCPYPVSWAMTERLKEAGWLEKVFNDDIAPADDVLGMPDWSRARVDAYCDQSGTKETQTPANQPRPCNS